MTHIEPHIDLQNSREQLMSYVDRIAEKIQPDALLHQLGLQRARETSMLSDTVLPALAIFGAGLLVGAGIALMATPKTGRELRDDLSRRAGEIGDKVRARMPRSSDDEESTASRSS